MIFFTADTHFNHTNILKLCMRPYYCIKEMNEDIIERWNTTVTTNDTVFHLGDFSFSDPIPFLARLNGQIIIIKGNHDNRSVRKKFNLYAHQMRMRIGNFFCLLNHRPLYSGTNKDHHKPKEEIAYPARYDFIISGHVHEKWLWTGRSLNVGVDQHDFTPISCALVLNLLYARKEHLMTKHATSWDKIKQKNLD